MTTKTERIHYGNATDKQREYIRSRINSELLCCQSALVDDLLKRGDIEGFEIDDMENVYPDPSDWTLEQCREYCREYGIEYPDPDPWSMDYAARLQYIRDEIDEDSEGTLDPEEALQCILSAIDDEAIDGLDDWRDAVRDNAEPNEAYEWYAVTNWLCGELRDRGEIVIDNNYGCWWGRGCTGQAVLLDPTFWDIFQDALQKGYADE